MTGKRWHDLRYFHLRMMEGVVTVVVERSNIASAVFACEGRRDERFKSFLYSPSGVITELFHVPAKQCPLCI